MKSNKNIFFILILIFLLQPTLSESTNIINGGTYEKGTDIEILQLCSYGGNICDACNISSIKYPNSSTIVSNVEMTKRESDFNYTLHSNYTNILGTYSVNGICEYNGDVDIFRYEFEVTPNGEPLSISKTIFYISLFFILIFLLILSIFGIGRFEGYAYNMGCAALSYLLFLVTTFVAWQLSENFLTSIPFISTILLLLLMVLLVCTLPALIIVILYLLNKASEDKDIKNLKVMGYSDREIRRIRKKK
jgi:hypothetical protein